MDVDYVDSVFPVFHEVPFFETFSGLLKYQDLTGQSNI